MSSVLTVYETNDIIQVQVLGRYYGHEDMCVIAWRSKQTQPFVDGIREHLQGWCTFTSSNRNHNHEWYGFRHRRVHPPPITDYGEYFFTAMPGAGSGDGMPGQMAALWRIETDVHSAWGKGRYYLPGVPMDHWTNGNYSLGAFSVKNGFKAQQEQWFREGGDSEHIEMVVYTRGTHDAVFNPMKEMSYSVYPAVQRSRRPPWTGT